MAKQFQGTRVNLSVTDGEGKVEVLSNLTEKAANEMIEEAKKAGQTEPSPTKIQSFTYHEAETASDFETLIPDEEARVTIFNRGYAIRQNQIVRDFMGDDEQPAVEGAYDLLSDAQSRTERRKATPEEKALKDLAALAAVDPAALARVLAQFAAQPVGA